MPVKADPNQLSDSELDVAGYESIHLLLSAPAISLFSLLENTKISTRVVIPKSDLDSEEMAQWHAIRRQRNHGHIGRNISKRVPSTYW